ncbi:MutS domain V [Paenibacillus algorifonticola]|uniref:MutS domain V n=1 Tax=Paenibacillus algorifonticola TaxID=684063 RepID=A0A1I2BQW7_9BACL|nr:DNA mismatch repair protein MutS [Paenibacillus algorifonticola]SFE58512.1 MutS domain V [Paenibacillus algorifonticola]
MMHEATLKRLEYDKLKERLIGYTVSPAGRLLAERHLPSVQIRQIQAWLSETEEASALLASGASIPLSAMEGIDPFLALLGKGRIYVEQELEQLLTWLASVMQMRRYMASKRGIAPIIASYADSMHDCPELREELGRCIRYGSLTDQASAALAEIRRHRYAVEDKISRKMEASLSKYKSALQESIVSKRSGRLVIAVKRELRKQVPGTVWDESASGQTLFVEPVDVADLQVELRQWEAEEERERTVILSGLSDLADAHEAELRLNLEAMASFDFIMARGKLSRSYDGQSFQLTDEPLISLSQARHPLLGESAVPLDVELGPNWSQLIITGPNTGGKTATLKTIGLLALLAQSGLLVPAREGSRFGIFHTIIADLGDGQSLEQSLSTFSSHIRVLGEMLESAGPRSLLLLDELAAGTDPGEGIALSIAVLEELHHRRALTAATTHFNEIKQYASRTKGCMNARMAFDPETLLPLYQLIVGEAGESHAFAIARRYGLPERVMQRAEQLAAKRQQSVTLSQDELSSDDKAGHTEAQTEAQVKNSSKKEEGAGKTAMQPLQAGDAVWIYPLKRLGIVFRPADARGEVIVQVQGRKLAFNRKRLKLSIGRAELYPGEDYDMSIVFDSKENRKLRKQLSRKHVEGLVIEMKPEAFE